jgi:hypothetical protein
MSEALTIDLVPDRLDVPKGCSPRQVRLAMGILNRSPDDTSTWTDLLKDAGYADSTIRSDALAIREAPGVRRALDVLQRKRADSARGLVGFGMGLVASANVDDLAARDKVFLGLDAVKKGMEMGESVEQTGDGSNGYDRKMLWFLPPSIRSHEETASFRDSELTDWPLSDVGYRCRQRDGCERPGSPGWRPQRVE